ncbi:MAG: sulfotransferase [Winogradskyella sp.]|uniref:sulfotransferase family protein n=1 Tax=Winogradskyella sp. TaxID=1883156 RepID=UPI0025CED598|nr:sulfotransferase [Winogradskyella sp.]NRB59550.1 sulfotransferase [Winogradskyella sp.]
MSFKPNINLFIVGAAKSGTTSLYNYLIQHPDVFFPKVKEPNFYSDIESEDPLAYKRPKKGMFYHNKVIKNREVYYSLYKEANNFKILGDASPSYLWDKGAAKKIHTDFPKAKILIILRNPIERTFSHYLMNLKGGIEKDSNALRAFKRDEKIIRKVWGDGKVLLYKELGLYSRQVQSYFEIFGKENVKVMIYEEFFHDTDIGLSKILAFLDLPNNYTFNTETIHNTFSVPKNDFAKLLIRLKSKMSFLKGFFPNNSKVFINKTVLFKPSKKPKMNDEVRVYLQNIFKKDIEALEKVLEKDLGIWKETFIH